MALIFQGATKCAVCGEIISDTNEITAFPAFLPEGHRLWGFSDAAFHTECFKSWSDRSEFEKLYSSFRDCWDSRPKIPDGMSFADFEQTDSFKEFEYRISKLFANDLTDVN